MKLKTGDQVIIQNTAVNQGTPGAPPIFVIHELGGYKGQVIVFASKMPHQQHIFRSGVQTIAERAACFVVLPDESDDIRTRLTNAFFGQPLSLQKGRETVLIINWRSNLPPLSNGGTNEKAELMDRGRKAIDAYDDWQRGGYMQTPYFRLLASGQN